MFHFKIKSESLIQFPNSSVYKKNILKVRKVSPSPQKQSHDVKTACQD